jgi:Zn-dependent peptidase ImmA (M78 family)
MGIMMTPEQLAANLIDEYCVKEPQQLKVEDIANAEKLFVIERPLNNFLGMINYEKNYGLITVSTRITSETQKIFTITHEMGHFFNERFKSEHLRGCKKDDLISYKSKRHNEDNANIFAAEFLMYKPWFLDYTKNTDLSIELIKETANHFKVSLTAAAIRFIEIGHFPSAIIYCVNKKVKWFAVHNHFPFKFISKDLEVPNESLAYKLFNGGSTITEKRLVRAIAWFNGQFNCKSSTYLYEQCISMPNYNVVMVLLTPSEFY